MGSILVLGANGFIGNCLVNELLKEHEVVGYDALASTQFIDHPRYQHIVGDYCTEKHFARILRDYRISVVYHLICTSVPKPGTEHLEEDVVQNMLPTLRLLDALAETGVKRIIFSSSGGTVYGEGSVNRPNAEEDRLKPLCGYGVQKAAIESYLHLYQHMHGLSPIIARIANPYGPNFQRNRTQGIIPILIRKLVEGEGVELYGDTIRDYLYIDDVIRALAGMIDYRGEETVFNVGSGEGIWLHDLIKSIETVVGREFSQITNCEIRSCDVCVNALDTRKIQRELGWSPSVPLSEGIRKTYLAMYAD